LLVITSYETPFLTLLHFMTDSAFGTFRLLDLQTLRL
jgi:hypothetical protein